MYRYRFDPSDKLLDIEWTGLFDGPGVTEYGRALRADFARSGFREGYRLLMDMSAAGIQPQDNLAHFREQFAGFPRTGRIAVATHSALHRLQILREMPQSNLRVTASRKAAITWLLHGVEEV